MTEIQLYNTRTRKKERFEPLEPGRVRMYVCGPTVYDRAHIGNARPVVVFDVLYRLLRHVYGENAVTYVRNFTDVDDKIIARAQETRAEGEALEDACWRITEETIRWYREDMGALGALPPTHEPRCTEYIPDMVAMIERLIGEGCAYPAEGHVLFDVAKFPRYGKLSRRSLEDMQAGARVEVAPYKKNPTDFVLWKPSTPEQPGWDSPWGRGRPGWHIECSAMAEALLGETFDIHAGGIDLLFPHHENEVAQSCCANHTEVMANFWMHNEFLQVEGEKMAKSLGNFFTVRDLLDEGLSGTVIRLVFLRTNYRQPLDWTRRSYDEARSELANWSSKVTDVDASADVPTDFMSALADDLNTHAALTVMHSLAKDGRPSELKACLDFLGIEPFRVVSAVGVAAGVGSASAEGTAVVEASGHTSVDAKNVTHAEVVTIRKRVNRIVERRALARQEKNFQLADTLRDGLSAAGIIVMDTPNGTDWKTTPDFDVTKLKNVEELL